MKKFTQQEFITQAAIKYHNKFDYSAVVYINGSTPVIIGCPVHGETIQRPLVHLHNSNFGCKDCGYEQRKHNKSTQQDFIDGATLIHGNKYDYSKAIYVDTHSKLEIICPIHGSFLQTPNAHISKRTGCLGCVGKIRHSTEQFIVFMKQHILDQELDFARTVYVNPDTKVTINCAIHGDFHKTPKEIFRHKSGCQKCEQDKRIRNNLIGHSKAYFDRNPEIAQLPAMVYVVRMTHETETFIKVGITKKTIEKRYQGGKGSDKYINKEILLTKYMSLIDAFMLEQKILTDLKDQQYWPNYVFDGRTECFKNRPEVVEQIQELMR